ncbi:NAD(P)-dependent dehydrogenase (short-subunit alcohol dehydrogenase family) [Crossiella equi]|uniref:NAD(P)-dependent dehydrogenase (Short-subunit alcohol dehydrogenase family) n=1 Tax=Crossiella equi TaxID=130796 RepID=A0ABS5ALR3_9PSEU|nr:oxidoreductase [Crossiella equi]MBP2477493.1 NAD(P)-dependent dehydrogenase (short-subunit alcohol dehydrogenase family) [Crossiella equi]
MATWFITGAARGFGLEIARQALDRRDTVVATARKPESIPLPESPNLLAKALDVTDPAQVQTAVAAAVARFGRIDVLVNNAGRGLLGAVEELSDAEVRAVYETNVFGLLTVTRAVLPVLRAQRSGHVLNIGSVGGFTTGAGWGVYGSTKFAVEGITEGLRAELAPLGIQVTVVEPGVFRTDFLDASSLHRGGTTIADYADTAGRVRDWAGENNHQQPGDPVKAAAAILRVAGDPEAPVRLQLGADCVTRVEAKLAAVEQELARWRYLAVSTGYDR